MSVNAGRHNRDGAGRRRQELPREGRLGEGKSEGGMGWERASGFALQHRASQVSGAYTHC